MPATEEDLENADGIIKEPSYYYTSKRPRTWIKTEDSNEKTPNDGPGPSSNLIRQPCTKFSHVAIVLYIEQVPLSLEPGQPLVLNYYSTPIKERISLMKFDDFARSVIKSKVRRIFTLYFYLQWKKNSIFNVTYLFFSPSVYAACQCHNRRLLVQHQLNQL